MKRFPVGRRVRVSFGKPPADSPWKGGGGFYAGRWKAGWVSRNDGASVDITCDDGGRVCVHRSVAGRELRMEPRPR